MRHEIRIRFDGKDIPGGVVSFLELAGCGPDVCVIEDVPVLRQLEVWVRLDNDDPRVLRLLSLLREHEIGWLEQHEDKFTEDELDSAKLIIMQSNGDCAIDGGVEWGTNHDLSKGCPACGTGAPQTSALFVDGRDVPKLEGFRGAATYFWHHLVDEGLAAALTEAGATGLSFRAIYAVSPEGRQTKLRWKQMVAAKTLPPMSPKSSGFSRDRVCAVCQRNGYFHAGDEPARAVYRDSDIRDADDVNVSWENHGYSKLLPALKESLLARPWMLVTPKVRRVFMEAGVTTFSWTPVLVDTAD